MRLFVLRHGRAEPHRVDDASRELVPSGRDDVRVVVERQQAMLAGVCIWSSPYLRALQTAAIAADVLGLPAEPAHVTDNLTPCAQVHDLLQEMYLAKLPALLIASHQPLVGDLIEALCPNVAPTLMKTATMAGLTLDVVAADFGRLDWLEHA